MSRRFPLVTERPAASWAAARSCSAVLSGASSSTPWPSFACYATILRFATASSAAHALFYVHYTCMRGVAELPPASGSSGPTLPITARHVAFAASSSRHNPREDNWHLQYFTVFDVDMQMRFLEEKPGWTTADSADCTREAHRHSRHLLTPHRVTILSQPLAHLPTPQLVLSPHQIAPSSRSRTVVCDFRPLGLGSCVFNLRFGASLFEGLSLERHRAGCAQALARLTRGEAGVNTGGGMADVFRPVPIDTASVHSLVWDHPCYTAPTAVPRSSTNGPAPGEHARYLRPCKR